MLLFASCQSLFCQSLYVTEEKYPNGNLRCKYIEKGERGDRVSSECWFFDGSKRYEELYNKKAELVKNINYYPNGQIAGLCKYKANTLISIEKYLRDGKKVEQVFYINNKIDRTITFPYDVDTNIVLEGIYLEPERLYDFFAVSYKFEGNKFIKEQKETEYHSGITTREGTFDLIKDTLILNFKEKYGTNVMSGEEVRIYYNAYAKYKLRNYTKKGFDLEYISSDDEKRGYSFVVIEKGNR